MVRQVYYTLRYNLYHKIGDRLARKFGDNTEMTIAELYKEINKRFLDFEELTFCSLEFNNLVRRIRGEM